MEEESLSMTISDLPSLKDFSSIGENPPNDNTRHSKIVSFLEKIMGVLNLPFSNGNYPFDEAEKKICELSLGSPVTNILQERIDELEHESQEYRDLYKKTEEELIKMQKDNRELMDQINRKNIELLKTNREIKKMLKQVGSCSNIQDVVTKVVDMQSTVRDLEEQLNQNNSDVVIMQIQENQKAETQNLLKIIRKQRIEIKTLIKKIEDLTKDNQNAEMMKDLCDRLKDTNKHLSRQMKQVINPKKGINNRSAMLEKEIPMNQSIWLSKTKEMIALETELLKTKRALNDSRKTNQILVNDNYRLSNDQYERNYARALDHSFSFNQTLL